MIIHFTRSEGEVEGSPDTGTLSAGSSADVLGSGAFRLVTWVPAKPGAGFPGGRSVPGGFRVREMMGAAMASMPSLLPGDEIYDVKAPVAIPVPWLSWFLHGALFLGVVYVLWRVLVWYITPGPVPEARPVPPPDPLKEARAALARLKRSPVWQEGRVKDICEALTAILKAYLKDKFRLGLGAASTTTELLRELQAQRVRTDLAERARELMDVCDGVKYAKGALGRFSLDGLFQQTTDLIEKGEWRT